MSDAPTSARRRARSSTHGRRSGLRSREPQRLGRPARRSSACVVLLRSGGRARGRPRRAASDPPRATGAPTCRPLAPGGPGRLVAGVVDRAPGRGRARRLRRGAGSAGVMGAAVALLFVFAFLLLGGSGQRGRPRSTSRPAPRARSAAVPLILGALAGVVCERSGVINVAIEGQLLAGAFVGALVGTLVDSDGVGMLGARARRRAHRRAAGRLRDQVLGQPDHPRRGAQRARRRAHRLLLRRAHAAATPRRFNQPPFLGTIKIPLLGDIPVIGPLLLRRQHHRLHHVRR